MRTDLASLWRRIRGHWIFTTLVMMLLVLSFRSAIADWNDVPTGSMQPTILIGDRIFVNKLAYDLKLPFLGTRLATWGDPRRGDVVVCWSPADGSRLVKRVIGVPGDQLAMLDGKLLINGSKIQYAELDRSEVPGDEDLRGPRLTFTTEILPGKPHVVAAAPSRKGARNFGPITVPEGQYFMMGDNRDNSADSRYFGYVSRSEISGRVQGIAFSLDYDNHYLPRWERFFAKMI